MKSEVIEGAGSIRRLPGLIDDLAPARVLIVTCSSSFQGSFAVELLAALRQKRPVAHYVVTHPNPALEQVEEGLAVMRREAPELLVAIGGGSVMDTAKLLGLLVRQDYPPDEIVTRASPVVRDALPVVAIPTTAGSGSEATQFAVVYIDGTKYSVEHPSMLPAHVILDHELTWTMPSRLTAVTGMDAIAQAVESFWGIRSNESSREAAATSLRLSLANLEASVRDGRAEAREAMSRAAFLAGQAIQVTRTSAPHALSYTLTSRFGVPHGHAASITLGAVLEFNGKVEAHDVADPRGIDFVRRRLDELVALLGARDPAEARDRLEDLMKAIGLETRLAALGVTEAAQRDLVARSVNAERLVNNPRALDAVSLRAIVDSIA